MLRRLSVEWKMAVMAAVLAVLLWVYADQHITRQESLAIPLRLVLPADIRAQTSVTVLRVRVSGPNRAVAALKEREGELRINYTPDVETSALESSKTITIVLTPNDVRLPAEVNILGIEPDTLQAKLIRYAEKTLSVSPTIVGEVASGYEIGENILVDPPSVAVRGPEDLLERLEAIPTEPVSVQGLKASHTRGGVKIATKAGDSTLECDRTVDVLVPIKRQVIQREFANIPVAVFAPADFPYRVNLSTRKSVSLRGTKEAISALRPEDIRLFVDVSGLKPRSEPYEEKVYGLVPPDVSFEGELGSVTFEILEPAAGVPKM